MMAKVLIDGVEYVPKVDIPNYSVSSLPVVECLRHLVSLHYFGEKHKSLGITLNAINEISPELAKLVSDDTLKAYELLNGAEDE